MAEHQINDKNISEEIDLIELIKNLWQGRRTIIKTVIICTAVGLLVAIFSPKEYTTEVVIVPQSANRQGNLGGLSGLAAIAGINLAIPTSTEISPTIYPQIVSSIPFKLELMATPLSFAKIEHNVTLYEYYSEYKKPNPLLKYTLGLPGVILKALKKEQSLVDSKMTDDLIYMTKKQKDVCDILSEKVSIELNVRDGYVILSCSMPEALPSAQLVKRTQLLLQQQITEYKIQKAAANLEFIQQRYNEVKRQYNQTQEALAKFSDSNKNVTTAIAQTESERLRNEYNLAYSIYSEMAKQLEQAKIQVKEDTPVFTVIEPATVPLKRSKPRRVMIMFVFMFLGGVIGVGSLLVKQYVR
jgi:Chain length determinant protein